VVLEQVVDVVELDGEIRVQRLESGMPPDRLGLGLPDIKPVAAGGYCGIAGQGGDVSRGQVVREGRVQV